MPPTRHTLYLVPNRIQHNQWPIHAPIPTESQTHILHLYRYLFRSEIKTNGRNIDGYYEARTHIVVLHQQQWTQNARETEMCFHHSNSYSNSYILHKSNKIRYVFLPFCHLYFSAFLMCVHVRERARTFTFVKSASRAAAAAEAEPGSFHSVICIWWPWPYHNHPLMVAHMRLSKYIFLWICL